MINLQYMLKTFFGHYNYSLKIFIMTKKSENIQAHSQEFVMGEVMRALGDSYDFNKNNITLQHTKQVQ